MKVLLIGATGTIGKAIGANLNDHEVVKVGNSGGDYQVDMNDNASIEALFAKTGNVDAVISVAGSIVFSPVKDLTADQYQDAINGKLLNHLNLFRIAQNHVNEGGSITFTSGDLAQNPMPGGAAVSLVNAALDSFVKAAALETGDALRVNTVNPHFVKETMEMMGMDSSSGISAADTAKAFRAAIEGKESGKIFDVPDYI